MVNVLVVDDDPMVRRLLRTILATDVITVVGEAGDGEQALAAVGALRPDVVLMDLRMPVLDGLGATRRVVALPDGPAVVAMTSFDTESAILEAITAGAAGFVAKDASPEELRAAVVSVAAGEGALSPRAAHTVVDYVRREASAGRRAAAEALAALSERELEVARHVAHGRSNAEIAAAVYLGEATVKTHLARACQKLGLTDRVQLALAVDRAGLGPA